MSVRIVKFFNRPLSIISAALLFHVAGAVAADSAGDAQQQARELLTGRIATESAPLSERRADRSVRPTGTDAQEQARRLLLGVNDSGVQGTKSTTRPDSAAAPVELNVQKGVPLHGDAQAMARRLLLGQSNATGS
jgi:hypothetical protein